MVSVQLLIYISPVCLREYSRIAVSSHVCSGRTSGRARIITFDKFSVQLLRWPRPRWPEACMEGSHCTESSGRRTVSSLLRQFVFTCTAESLECLREHWGECKPVKKTFSDFLGRWVWAVPKRFLWAGRKKQLGTLTENGAMVLIRVLPNTD